VVPAETVIIAGPTGAGKTDLSLRLAGLLQGEIVGADAFQIYAGLPILTAQPSEVARADISHHFVGSIDPAEAYDAGRYLQEARLILEGIVARGRTPIVVGGTGLYIKALLGGLEEMPGNDPALREQFAGQTLPELIGRLREADPDAEHLLDLANRRRVERALEIILLSGKPLAASRTGSKTPPPGIRPLLITREREELHARIAVNVESMFVRGVEREVASLPEEKTGPTASMTLGLRELRALARGEISREEAQEAITKSTRQYAKRQMTWFTNQHRFPVLNLSRFSDPAQAREEALRLLAKKTES
jgi:tRNA dimethylallyltransferase